MPVGHVFSSTRGYGDDGLKHVPANTQRVGGMLLITGFVLLVTVIFGAIVTVAWMTLWPGGVVALILAR